MKKKIADLHKVWKEALMLHEVYRRLGFPSEEIFLLIARSANPEAALLHQVTSVGDLCVCVAVRSQDLEYVGCIGPVPCAEEEAERQWDHALQTFNGCEKADFERAWRSALIPTRITLIAWAMHQKGFTLKPVQPPSN